MQIDGSPLNRRLFGQLTHPTDCREVLVNYVNLLLFWLSSLQHPILRLMCANGGLAVRGSTGKHARVLVKYSLWRKWEQLYLRVIDNIVIRRFLAIMSRNEETPGKKTIQSINDLYYFKHIVQKLLSRLFKSFEFHSREVNCKNKLSDEEFTWNGRQNKKANRKFVYN